MSNTDLSAHQRSSILPPSELVDHLLHAEFFFDLVFYDPIKDSLDINRYLDMSPQKLEALNNRMIDDAFSSDDAEKRVRHISTCWSFVGQYFARLAAKDGLTGLFNKSSFTDAIQDTIEQLNKRRQLPVEYRKRATINKSAALIDIDIDRFKPFNDILSHATGDSALIEVGNLLKDFTRPSDYSGRMGGDEFSLLLIDVDADDAALILTRLKNNFNNLGLDLDPETEIKMSDENRAKIGRKVQDKWLAKDLLSNEYAQLGLNVTDKGSVLRVSIDASFGTAMFKEGMSAKDIDAEADRTMYDYKNTHRNPAYVR